MKTARLLLAPLVFASSLAAGCGNNAPSVPPSAIAVVGDRTISRAEFDALMRSPTRPAPGVIQPSYRVRKDLVVRLLVERAVLEQKAPELGIHVTETKVRAQLQQLKEDSFGGSEQRYRARLKSAGMTDDQVRAALRAQLLTQAVRQAVAADVVVGTPTVKEYYEDHLNSYSTPRSRTVRHILVKSRAVAARLYSRVRSGASFAALARSFSRDPTTRDRGGRLTVVEGGNPFALDQVAFSLATGAVSKPFRTRYGWELIEAVSAIRPRRTKPFASVRETIRRRLLAQRRAQAFGTWLAKAKEDLEPRTAYASGFAPDEG